MGRIALCLLIILSLVAPVAAAVPYTGPELSSGYIIVVDENGSIILETGLPVHPGDGFISEDNRYYEVTSVEGTLARARFVRYESPEFAVAAQPVQAPAPAAQPEAAPAPAAPAPALATQPGQRIAVYYTHNDESYIPTDGRATIRGNGSIFKVGAAFAQRLTELGYTVDNSQTRHDPHDANAYQRSRRTFKKLQEQGPVALFDIHRDSAPASAYQTTINGQPATKMLLVEGRQNQNRQSTMNFAQKIKAAADSKYKGLIRGIFIAHGNYNQDLNPQAMLVEIGTQYNSREAAERSAALFADLVPVFLAGMEGTAQAAPPSAGGTVDGGGGYGGDILTVIGVLIAGVAGYLFISTGSWREAKRKLANFRKYEFANFLGRRKKRQD